MSLNTKIESVGIVGGGSMVGGKICEAIPDKEFGIKEVYLCDFDSMRDKIEIYADSIDKESKGRIKVVPVDFNSVGFLFQKSDLIFITCSHPFGARGQREEDYLEIERRNLAGKTLSAIEKREFELAAKIYECLQALSMDRTSEYRIFNELPYNLDIIKNLAIQFRPYKDKGKIVVPYSNPIDLMTYIFSCILE